MASVSQHHKSQQWEVRFKCVNTKAMFGRARQLQFPPHAEAEARAAAERIQAQINKGEMPTEFAGEAPTKGGDFTSAAPTSKLNPDLQTKLHAIFAEFELARRVSDSDKKLFSLMIDETGNPTLAEMTLQWAEDLVKDYKDPERMTPGNSGKNICLAPSSIRKRIGALTRATDWFQSKIGVEFPISFSRVLGRGYSHYADGLKKDISRDRLFEAGEEKKVLAVLNGSVKDERKADLSTPAFRALYTVIRNTGMRLREAYTLRAGWIDFDGAIINVNGSKGHYGAIKKRPVAMLPMVEDALREACAGKEPGDLVFPYWDGADDTHEKVSAYLSQAFGRLFKAAEVPNMREHDLRHVATVQWVTAKLEDGHYAYSETEVMTMMGWTSRSMLDRYIKGYRAANLGTRTRKIILAA